MVMRQIVALMTAVALAAFAGPLAFAQQAPAPGTIAGTAKNEAKKPYTDYTVRARVVTTGTIATTVPLDTEGNFVFRNLTNDKYVLELFQTRNKSVVCTEGPFGLTPDKPAKIDVDISCGIPALLWLVPVAAAVPIAVVTNSGSGSR